MRFPVLLFLFLIELSFFLYGKNETIAIQNAKILTVTQGNIEVGTILIENGKIKLMVDQMV